MLGEQLGLKHVQSQLQPCLPAIQKLNKLLKSQHSSSLVALSRQSDSIPTNLIHQKISLGSVSEYISLQNDCKQVNPQPFWLQLKNRSGLHEQKKRIDVGEAERILVDSKQRAEKIIASKIIAETMFKNIYGQKVKKFELEQRQKENMKPKNLINLSSLEIVMNEMEFDPRSHSIMLRKQELQKIRNQFRKKSRKLITRGESDNPSIIEIIYRLKNQYSSLKNIIIPTKSLQYEYFVTFYSQHPQSSSDQHFQSSQSIFYKTALFSEFKITKECDEQTSKKNEYFQKFRAYKNSSSMIKHSPSKFSICDQELILENIMQMKPPLFMYLIHKCKFSQLKVIKFKSLRINEELLLLFLECLSEMSEEVGCLDYFQLSSIFLQNRARFSQKISLFLREIPIKKLKLESMDLCTNELNKIYYGLVQCKELEQVSLRHNRIDILGVRNMENIIKLRPKLKVFDVRNNDIPHYANLKDKSSIIVFF